MYRNGARGPTSTLIDLRVPSRKEDEDTVKAIFQPLLCSDMLSELVINSDILSNYVAEKSEA